jgi:hypothetical protein
MLFEASVVALASLEIQIGLMSLLLVLPAEAVEAD